MKFSSHEERMQHPEAGIVSKSLWDHSIARWHEMCWSPNSELLFLDSFISLIKKIHSAPKDLIQHLKYCLPQSSGESKQIGFIIVSLYADLKEGTIDEICRLLDLSIKDLFYLAAEANNLSLITKLIAIKGKMWAKEVFRQDNYFLGRDLAACGSLQSFMKFAELFPSEFDSMLKAYNYAAFYLAICYGNLEIVRYLREKAPMKFNLMVAENHEGVCEAAELGNLSILQYIAKEAPKEFEDILTKHDDELFYKAVREEQQDIIRFLLAYPTIFAYAESQQDDYDDYIQPIIKEILAGLRETDREWLQKDTSLGEKEAKQLFYIARALIRRNAPLEDVRLILELPKVSVLVHQTIIPGKPNELLRLAASSPNTDVFNYLSDVLATSRETQKKDVCPEPTISQDQSKRLFSTETGASLQFFYPKNGQEPKNDTLNNDQEPKNDASNSYRL